LGPVVYPSPESRGVQKAPALAANTANDKENSEKTKRKAAPNASRLKKKTRLGKSNLKKSDNY
jgi:hypothetical protein